MLFKKSIFSKILLASMVMVLLIVGLVVLNYYLFAKNDVLEEAMTEAHNLQTFLAEREIDHHLWMIKMYDMFAGGPIPDEIQSPHDCNLGQWYYSFEPSDRIKEYFDALEAPHVQLHNSSREVVNLFRNGNEEQAIKLFREETIPAVNGVRENLQKIKEIEGQHLQGLEDQMASLDASITRTMIIAAVICFILAILISFILTRIIARPLRNIAGIVQGVAEGDLTRNVDIDREDEIGQLASSISIMIKKLKHLLNEINKESNLVAEASTQLKMSSDETGQTAQEIASSMIQVAEGSEDTSNQINVLDGISAELAEGSTNLRDNVETSLKVARDSEKTAEEGFKAVEKAIKQLDVVTETVNFATDSIEKLGKRSTQIGDMVALIDGIASQTNLLALNAAIEAARAGEHGTGFAVVAEEVRKLAEESGEAAGKITSLIEDIQSETTATVNSMDVNSQEVDSQIEIINKAGDSLQNILEMSNKTRINIEQIKEFTKRLESKSGEMSESIASIASAVEENAASTEEVSAFSEEQSASMQEVAASAEEMDKMAQKLKELISEFKTGEE